MDNFILDTSVILDNPDIVLKLNGKIIIPFVVILELEKNKTRDGETGVNARKAIRIINEIRKIGNLNNGVLLKNGSTLIVKNSPRGCEDLLHDDIIIKTAESAGKSTKTNTFLLTNDLAMKIKADCKKVLVQDIKVEKTQDDVYSGECHLKVPTDIINKFFIDGYIELDEEITKTLNPNEFVCMSSSPQHSALGRVVEQDDKLIIKSLRSFKNKRKICGIDAKNKEQDYAFELLMDENVHLVSMCGKAGCGKTILALAAAWEQVKESTVYERVIVMRPTVAVGNDIGYLPGTLEEKMMPWIQPIKDNLEVLIGGDTKNRVKKNDEIKKTIDLLFEDGTFQVEALTYVRGRSIPRSFIIVDEAQNLTPAQIKTILTRAGIGSKIVLTGDIEQIDIHKMDVENNGLSRVINNFKSYTIAGHVTLQKGQRSPLATLAADIL